MIPLWRISSAISKIPLLDEIAVGDDGKGIMALTYTVTGTVNKPVVTDKDSSFVTPLELHILFGLAEPERKKIF